MLYLYGGPKRHSESDIQHSNNIGDRVVTPDSTHVHLKISDIGHRPIGVIFPRTKHLMHPHVQTPSV